MWKLRKDVPMEILRSLAWLNRSGGMFDSRQKHKARGCHKYSKQCS